MTAVICLERWMGEISNDLWRSRRKISIFQIEVCKRGSEN
jgi:hypothetical protein